MSTEPISSEAKLLIQLGEMVSKLWKARDRAWKLARERNHWKRESLEQARLLAMSADREEKMRDALKYIAGLDTSQGTSPQQCSAVAVAMEALQ